VGANVAIVIGVGGDGRTLPVLEGAREDAKTFAAWASANGADGQPRYQTRLIVDEPGRKVTVDDITRKIEPFLEDTVDRLVLFFSGHGVSNHAGDLWLLSDYSRRSEQAVNVALSIRNARRHPIRQIAVFSDACRSSVNQAALIGGSSLFSIADRPGLQIAQYDEFFSTDIGSVAQEIASSDATKAYGLFSRCLFKALDGDAPDAVEIRKGSEVVSSESLAKWLQKVVPFESGKIPGGVVQTPWVTPGWMSPEDIYLDVPATAEPRLPPLHKEWRLLGGDDAGGGDPAPLRRARLAAARRKVKEAEARRDAEIQERTSDFQAAQGRQSFETRQGLTIIGPAVLEAVTGPDRQVDVFEEDGAWHVRGYGGVQSVAVQLDDGHWAPAVILPGFVGTLVVTATGLQSLNYAPMRSDPARGLSQPVEDQVAHWNALLGLHRGVPVGAMSDFADNVRQTKHVNPAYGILAAYAYDRAGRLDDVERVAGFFARENHFVPFDVAYLTDSLRLARQAPNGAPVAGGFPLLSYGWSLLDPALTALEPALLDLRGGLLRGAWASFEPETGRGFAELVREGRV
jgi:hypothetical protein